MRHLLTALSLSLIACGSAEDPAVLDQTLDSSFGGQTEADELPAFGDAEVTALSAEDPSVTDTMTPADDMPNARHVRIAVAWGYLRPHPDATETIDWSGSIKVENAAVRVLRVLRFEERDMVVRPRTDRTLIEFESHTKPHADGLLLDVIVAPALNPTRGPVTLTLTTPPYAGTLKIEAGMQGSRVVTVDDDGHVVAYHVIRPDADGCASGFMRGVWRTAENDNEHVLGELRGRFTAADGRVRGELRGLFGVRENGHQVWFAKVVDKDGKFMGVLAGRYGDGKLAGLYLGKGREIVGVVHGQYRDGDGDADGGFIGRYSERCGDAPGEGTTTDGDEPDISLDDVDLPADAS